MEKYNPDVVVLEKVERNLKELATDPPFTGTVPVSLGQDMEIVKSDTLIKVSESSYNTNYIEVSGILDNLFCTEDVKVYVRVKDNKGQNSYETFYVSDNKTDYGYRLYIPKEEFNDSSTVFEVVIENKGELQVVKSASLNQEETRELIGDSYLKKKKEEERKIVSKEKVYDCDGSGHGYYVITWSDGETEYEDF